MNFWKKRRKKKAERRRNRLEKGGFWSKYYRFTDRLLGKWIYAKKCMQCPIDPNLVVFESFKGKFYSCNPKELFEEMQRDPSYAGYRFVWSFGNCARREYLLRNFKRVTLVKKGSKEYYEAMATAKYRITNSITPFLVPPRKGQVYIQTWHGTPLKRLGMDIALEGNSAQSLKEIHKMYKLEGKQSDFLLSPSPYTTEKLATAFGLNEEEKKKKIVELGYPRNVALFRLNTPEQIAELKRFYKIPEGKKVILYAPTFREGNYQYGKGFIYQIVLDIERLRSRFGDRAVVLMRTHYLANAQFDYIKYAGFLIKVSGVEDINRLYLVSDLLVTDYSSVMFDFSILRRPMIFYMYDAEQYRGELRDFYIEPDILPGPIVTTQDALEEEIEKALFTPFVCDEKYEAFCRQFVPKDDADAAKRVLAATVAPQRKPLPLPKRLVRYKERQKKLDAFEKAKRKLENGYIRQKSYAAYLKKPIEEKTILLESQQGREMDGNVFALLTELATNPAYADFTLCLTAREEKASQYKSRLAALGMQKVHVLRRTSRAYFKVLATAKYLINDNTFLESFVKREGQVYLNTWHGTPLKTLGKKIKQGGHTIGNAQKNLLAADYMLFPNEYTMEHMVEDYMLSNLGTNEIWLTGYPRNSVFFRTGEREALRKKYGMDGKKVFAFLPTWRTNLGKVSGKGQVDQLTSYLSELDSELPDDYLIYIRLHVMNPKEFPTEEFLHIRAFPDDCGTYEFLNATDGLITDYSSVMFDYAITRRKIILFTFDKETYEATRGFYFPLSELPFPQAENAEELLLELLSEKKYDETEFLKKFCPWDGVDVPKEICKKFLCSEAGSIKTLPVPDNKKKNVVLYGGALHPNGVTTSFFNLLSQLNADKYNYIVLYKTEDMKEHPGVLQRIPETMATLGASNGATLNFRDTVCFKLWTKKGIFSHRFIEKKLDNMAKWDSRRLFSGCRVDKLVHFSGYSNDMTTFFGGLSCDKTIFVHSDMEQETKKRRLVRPEVLARAYQEYDSVAVVTEELRASVERLAGSIPARTEKKPVITAVKNVIDYERVLRLSEKELQFDITTLSNVPLPRLREILDGDAVKFVNIGRFSEEKGHARLLNAFDKIHAKHPDTYLIIVGSRGALYEETLRRAQGLASYDHIVIIHYMSNPYALLKQCDYFIFSSFYEGFGLVLAEADICGVRCVSTKIDGPRRFMERYGGYLVENSDAGVYEGMQACLEGKVEHLLSVDYAEYNKEAVAQFESLLP